MAFGNEIKQGNIVENWLFDFENDNSGFLRLSFQDMIDSSNFYHGVVLNTPTIRHSINLKSSTAQSSNISINIPDFKYGANPVSKELFGGTNSYINHAVSVYIKIGSATKQQVGSFRLTDISSDGNVIKLSMVTKMPWDFISIPQSTSGRNIYAPIAYGNYTKNPNSSFSSPQFVTDLASTDYFPVPFHNSQGGHHEFITGDFNLSSNAEVAFYDDALDTFLPLDSPKTSTTARGSIFVARIENLFYKRGFKHRTNAHNDLHTQWSNETNAYDTSTGTFASFEKTIASSAGNSVVEVDKENTDIQYFFTVPTGKLSQGSLAIEFQTNHTSGNFNSSADTIEIETFVDYTGTGSNFEKVIDQDHTACDGSTNNHTITKTYSEGDSHPDSILIGVHMKIIDASIAEGNELTITARVRIKDIVMTAEMFNEEKDGLQVYCGADGYVNSWNGSAITEILDTHLDLLIRYAGVTQKNGSDISDPTSSSQVDGYSAVKARSNDWNIRYWLLEPDDLKNVLEKLQYEGGFIFRYKSDGTPQYIHIPDSISSSATLTKRDIRNITVKPASISELLTKMNIFYRKHPTNDRYINNVTSSSGNTIRNKYNIQTKENIQEVSLEAYIGDTSSENDIPATATSNRNDDFWTYYFNIFGDVKIIVSCEIVNPSFYSLEVGDIISFSDMYPDTPFGHNSANWSGLNFMITSLQRSVGKLKIESREL